MSGVNGVRGFLDRVWRMIVDDRADNLAVNAALSDEAPTAEQLKMLHQTIKSVTVDTENLDFNTAIARDDGVCQFLHRSAVTTAAGDAIIFIVAVSLRSTYC